MLSWRTKNLVPVVAIVLSLFVLGIANNARATEECWVDLAVPYGQITVGDAYALINGYVALGGFDFDQDGQPEFIDHNGDGVYNSADVLGIWNEYVNAWVNAYYYGCAPAQTEETVPVSGGVVVAEDGGAVVEIPAGALLETTTITVTPLEDGPFTNWGELEAYEFGPDGTQFQTPVSLSLSYADMGPVDPNTLSIVTYEGGDWVAIPVVDIDYSAQVVVGETTHFSTYALTTAPAAAIGQGCGVAGNQMRLPAWNKDKFLQSNRTCGVNGRGAIVGNCSGDWSEVLWTDEDPTTDDHLSSVHADDTRHRCWWRSGGTHKTGEECEIPVPAPDRTEAAPEDWYIVNHPTESFTCYDLDECVAGATCDSGICGLIDVTETGDERIRVADVSEWTAADLDGSYLKQKYGCVCNEGYIPDGKGGCELLCEPGYKNPGDDVCILDCALPHIYDADSDSCILDCVLPRIYDADSDSCILDCALPHIYDADSDSCILDCALPHIYDVDSDSCILDCVLPHIYDADSDSCIIECQDGYYPEGSSCLACECSEISACCDGCRPQNVGASCDDLQVHTENDECNDLGVCEGIDWIGWVDITGGDFQMGSNEGVNSFEEPVHTVSVPSFAIMRTEVTVEQYRQCSDAGGCAAMPAGNNNCSSETMICNYTSDPGPKDDHPMNLIDWHHAREFCSWIGGRLPSEAEWEYAARDGGQQIKYPWGNTPDPATCLEAVKDGCPGYTQPVCSTTAGITSTYGLCDMAGNVSEWVEDETANYDVTPVDGSAWTGPPAGGESTKIRRGGDFWSFNFELRTAARVSWIAAQGKFEIGFRCARDGN